VGEGLTEGETLGDDNGDALGDGDGEVLGEGEGLTEGETDGETVGETVGAAFALRADIGVVTVVDAAMIVASASTGLVRGGRH
jgi:hypothetical protein